MNTQSMIKIKLEKVFNAGQAAVLAEVINYAYTELVKTGDFNELKAIVKDIGIKVGEFTDAQKGLSVALKELAETQKMTEEVLKEPPAGGQKKTEEELQDLIQEHKQYLRSYSFLI
jgi:hypothetical protein